MEKQISELREMIENEDNYTTWKLLEKLNKIEVLSKELKPKSSKFVELSGDGLITLIRRKSITAIEFQKEDFSAVDIFTRGELLGNFNVSENQEVIENLIADFKS